MAIHVLLLTLDLALPDCHSLKEKRQVLKSMTAHLRQKLNVSVAEVDDQELWQSATVAIALVSTSAAHNDQVSETALRMVESDPRIQLASVTREQF